MYINWYYVHFANQINLALLESIFVDCSEFTTIQQIVPNGFEILSPMPRSELRYALSDAFPNCFFYFAKLKKGDIHTPD